MGKAGDVVPWRKVTLMRTTVITTNSYPRAEKDGLPFVHLGSEGLQNLPSVLDRSHLEMTHLGLELTYHLNGHRNDVPEPVIRYHTGNYRVL